jgi:hypothetical protein
VAAVTTTAAFQGVPTSSGCFCNAIAEPVVSVKCIAYKHYKDKTQLKSIQCTRREGLKGREEKDIDNEAPARAKCTGVNGVVNYLACTDDWTGPRHASEKATAKKI